MVAVRWARAARAARWKPAPAHSTTGVARTAASHCHPGYCRAGTMARARTGRVRAAAATSRPRSSSSGSVSAGPRPTA
ncbi:MAG: hypothetical protein ACJ75K_08550 [Actinomycetes bacterium]